MPTQNQIPALNSFLGSSVYYLKQPVVHSVAAPASHTSAEGAAVRGNFRAPAQEVTVPVGFNLFFMHVNTLKKLILNNSISRRDLLLIIWTGVVAVTH